MTRRCMPPRIVALSERPTSYIKLATANEQVLFVFDDGDAAQTDLALEQASRVAVNLRGVPTMSVWRAGAASRALQRLPVVGCNAVESPGFTRPMPARPFAVEMPS